MDNRFVAARRRYLRTHMAGIYTGMLLAGTLEPHLKEISGSAQAMFDRIVEQTKKDEGVTDQLKAADQVESVGINFLDDEIFSTISLFAAHILHVVCSRFLVRKLCHKFIV